MNDEQNQGGHEQKVNQSAHNMKDEEGSDPNEKQNERKDQKKVAHETRLTEIDCIWSMPKSL